MLQDGRYTHGLRIVIVIVVATSWHESNVEDLRILKRIQNMRLWFFLLFCQVLCNMVS